MANEQEMPTKHPWSESKTQSDRTSKKDELDRTKETAQVRTDRRYRKPIPNENPSTKEIVLQNRHQNCEEIIQPREETSEQSPESRHCGFKYNVNGQ